MIYAILGLIILASVGLALYALINKGELISQVAALQAEVEEQDASHFTEIENGSSGIPGGYVRTKSRGVELVFFRLPD